MSETRPQPDTQGPYTNTSSAGTGRAIAVLTSGGDAPGMNAALRAIARQAADLGVRCIGVRDGFEGLVQGRFIELTPRQVGGIIQQGGTILGSARSEAYKTEQGRRQAVSNLERSGISGVVVIGGNGSQTGASLLNKLGVPTVGVASTIDNDLIGGDPTLGVDTALNIALECIDRLKVTAASHRRAFIVEVMGRDCGYLALMAALAGGAEAVAIPERETDPEKIAWALRAGWERGKRNGLVVVAEGASLNADGLLTWFKDQKAEVGFELRETKIGHVQRGGAPLAADRILGTRTGAEAARLLIEGQSGIVVGMIGGELVQTPYDEVAGRTKAPDTALLALAETMTL